MNQRLLCAEAAGPGTAGCVQPLAYMQDLGQTFGPKSIDLDGWTRTPVWADPAACRVSMRGLPWDGATFEDTTISEAGRLFLAGLLRQLTAPQVREPVRGGALHRVLPQPGRGGRGRLDARVPVTRGPDRRPPALPE